MNVITRLDTLYSKSSIELIEIGGTKIVRKTSSSIDYNISLERSCNKQKDFISGLLKTPKVLESGYTVEGLFYFDMEYIDGTPLSEEFKTARPSEVRRNIESIMAYVDENRTVFEADCSNFIKERIRLLKEKSFKTSLTDFVFSILERYDWSGFRKGPCHGNLTLENIILRGSDLYLIDFKDIPYSSWMTDISSLIGDTLLRCCYRDITVINPLEDNLRVASDAIFSQLLLLDAIDCGYILMLQMLEFYSEAKDPTTFKFIDKMLNRLIGIVGHWEGKLNGKV